MENKDLQEKMAELLNGLTDAQKEKAKACQTMEELTAFLGGLGIALPDELLDAAAGGTTPYAYLFQRHGSIPDAKVDEASDTRTDRMRGRTANFL